MPSAALLALAYPGTRVLTNSRGLGQSALHRDGARAGPGASEAHCLLHGVISASG